MSWQKYFLDEIRLVLVILSSIKQFIYYSIFMNFRYLIIILIK